MSLDVIGSRSVSLSPSAAETSDASRERIWFLLPRSVLISPLWQSARKGCARLQLGKVLVEKRECTSASRGSSPTPARASAAPCTRSCPCAVSTRKSPPSRRRHALRRRRGCAAARARGSARGRTWRPAGPPRAAARWRARSPGWLALALSYPPAQLVDVLLEDGLALGDRFWVVREEEVAHAVLARRRQAGLDAPKEGVWHTRQDAGTVTGIGLAAAATAVGHAHEHRVRVCDDLVARLSLQACDHAHATAILFECGIVEALLGWEAFQAWGGGGYSPERASRQRAGRAAAKRPHQATQH
eukprot:scaffold72828_cov69-Phaeocystis_antarctica.AAC.3